MPQVLQNTMVYYLVTTFGHVSLYLPIETPADQAMSTETPAEKIRVNGFCSALCVYVCVCVCVHE